jgi:hypothetical protein
MKKEQLKQLRHLKNEIRLLQKQIAELDYPVTSDVVKGSMTEFPYIEQHIRITGIDEEGYKRRLNRLKRKLKRKLDELMDLVEEANEYINGIDDSLIRQILSLRYVNGLTWEQVAASIGGGNTADSVRKAAERFLEKAVLF